MESYAPNYAPTVLILDGAHALRRALYAPNTRELSNSQGVPTGGVFQFFNSLNSTLSSFRCSAVVVCWEGGHSERRMELYPEYKDRHIDPDAPVERDQFGMTDYEYYGHQMSWVKKILEYYGIPQVSVVGKEGDDVLYQVIHLLKGNKIIVSEDRDFFSLISEDVSCYRPIKKEYVELGNFEDISGYQSPRHFLYAKCLMGDGSDNIPSVAKGVGEGTISKILKRIGNPDEVTGQRILKEAAELGDFRSKKLVAAGLGPLNRNLDLIDISREGFNVFELQSIKDTLSKQVYPDIAMVTKLFHALEFGQDTISAINFKLGNMSSFPLTQLINNDYIRKAFSFETNMLNT